MFASKRVGREKFEAITHDVAHGVPVLDDALAWLVCELRELVPAGDHTIGIGEVTEMDAREGEPLVFHRGRLRLRLSRSTLQREERGDQRRRGHHAQLAAHDREHDRPLPAGSRRADRLRVLEPAGRRAPSAPTRCAAARRRSPTATGSRA